MTSSHISPLSSGRGNGNSAFASTAPLPSAHSHCAGARPAASAQLVAAPVSSGGERPWASPLFTRSTNGTFILALPPAFNVPANGNSNGSGDNNFNTSGEFNASCNSSDFERVDNNSARPNTAAANFGSTNTNFNNTNSNGFSSTGGFATPRPITAGSLDLSPRPTASVVSVRASAALASAIHGNSASNASAGSGNKAVLLEQARVLSLLDSKLIPLPPMLSRNGRVPVVSTVYANGNSAHGHGRGSSRGHGGKGGGRGEMSPRKALAESAERWRKKVTSSTNNASAGAGDGAGDGGDSSSSSICFML